MFTNLFEERDKTISLLVKLGDCIGRSLRENVVLFSIDSFNEEVIYLTESEKIISGNYSLHKDVKLNNIKVQDSSVLQDGEAYDEYISERIHNFVQNIHFGEYASADTSFSNILSLWENRVKLDSVQAKLADKAHRLDLVEEIIETKEFANLEEVKPQLIKFLKENFDKISTIPEIKNAVNLSNVVARSFDFPRLTLEELEDRESYQLKDGVNLSIYEMICRQELVKKELIESKKNFEMVWATNPSINKLASAIFEEDETVVKTLIEALEDVPYLALASKKSLFNTFSNCLAQVDGIGVSEKDIQQYASEIFEIKKAAKESLIQNINEKYGVNIQNLQEPTSFKSLINTQIVIFEALSRIAPKGSVLKQVLSEVAGSFKGKSGVQSIDVNEFLADVFYESGYSEILEASAAKAKTPKLKRTTKKQKEVANSKKEDMYPSDETLEDTKGEDEESPATANTPEATPVAPGLPEQPGSEEDLVANLADLDTVMADIAAELGFTGDENEKDSQETDDEDPDEKEDEVEEKE